MLHKSLGMTSRRSCRDLPPLNLARVAGFNSLNTFNEHVEPMIGPYQVRTKLRAPARASHGRVGKLALVWSVEEQGAGVEGGDRCIRAGPPDTQTTPQVE